MYKGQDEIQDSALYYEHLLSKLCHSVSHPDYRAWSYNQLWVYVTMLVNSYIINSNIFCVL